MTEIIFFGLFLIVPGLLAVAVVLFQQINAIIERRPLNYLPAMLKILALQLQMMWFFRSISFIAI